MDFAAVFADLRRKAGYSQRYAAEALGISQALLSHYEKGIREPRLDFVEKACRFYGVSADRMLGMRGAVKAPSAAAKAAAVCFALETMCMAPQEDAALVEAALQLARIKFKTAPDSGREALLAGMAYYAADPAPAENEARKLLERLKTEV